MYTNSHIIPRYLLPERGIFLIFKKCVFFFFQCVLRFAQKCGLRIKKKSNKSTLWLRRYCQFILCNNYVVVEIITLRS